MNIIDYVKKYGNLSFEEKEFNEIDSLILCELSYCRFEYFIPSIFSNEPYKTINNIIKKEENINALIKSTLVPKKNKKLIDALKSKKRFKDIKIGEYWSVFDEKSENQFFALTFFLPNGSMYICFRGTDITLLGWREDFNMSFLKTNICQKESEEYTKYILKKYPDRMFYLGGHSKGGNLAFYIALRLKKEHLPYLLMSYSHDGPGFIDVVKSTFAFHIEEIKDKLNKTVPYNSIVGFLLDGYKYSNVVKASSFSIFQHDPFNWQIDKEGQFIYLPQRSSLSIKKEKAMDEWLSSLNMLQRQFLTNFIFSSLGGNDLTIKQMSKYSLRIIKTFIKNYKILDEENKVLIKSSINKLIEFYKDFVFKR